MNINQKLDSLPVTGGIPRYNRKCNELVKAVNWLLGVQTSNGKQIIETPKGPVIPTGDTNPPPAPDQAQPWLVAPNGEAAIWKQVTVVDTPNGQVYDLWAWTSQTPMNPRWEVWLKDPNGVSAQWVSHDVCVGGSIVSKWFWGTP